MAWVGSRLVRDKASSVPGWPMKRVLDLSLPGRRKRGENAGDETDILVTCDIFAGQPLGLRHDHPLQREPTRENNAMEMPITASTLRRSALWPLLGS